MILDCYQCSSCYFEDKEPSSRIDSSAIEVPQSKMVFSDALVVFVCIEVYDSKKELEEAVEEFASLSDLIGKRPIVLCPNVHLSVDKAPEKQAVWLVRELEKMLIAKEFKVHRLSFGYHKKFGMECNGNVGSVVGRRFYGSKEKQFLRLLTRLGVCPPQSVPDDMPSWAKLLTERRLKLLASRRETYNVAKKILGDQLDATGRAELWTCMLLEGERHPMEDYLSLLYRIIKDYPDVTVHRALNLSVPDFSEAAQRLFHKYPDAINSGRLCIYNSTISDMEFLLSRTAVLLAFPLKPEKADSDGGEISFGVYCEDEYFARNLIRWYERFLVDARFGKISTEAGLHAAINELQAETSRDRRE